MRRSIFLAVVLAVAGCGAFKDDASSDGGASDGSTASSDSSAASGGDASGNSSSGGSDASGSGDDNGGGDDDAGTVGLDASHAGDGEAGATTGAGPLGDLPSGYCCTSDSDCRNRYCVDPSGTDAGNRMCEDECDGAQTLCNGLLPNFTCTAVGDDGFCTPPTTTTACVPASQYVHGTKATGACCSATGNATSGQECLGGNCGATGSDSNPFVCENACNGVGECPAGSYQCLNIGEYSVCAPLAAHYTCQ